jgi:AAA ATPase domain/AAA domain
MRLVAFRLHGYRRFEAESTLDLTPRVVAIVGPNEAGKTSLLNALEVLGDPAQQREFNAAEFTGRSRRDDDDEILSGLFELEESDKSAIAHIPGASKVRLWRRLRTADGEASGEVIPRIERDQKLRLEVDRDLQRVLDNRTRRVSDFLDGLGVPLADTEGDDEAAAGRDLLVQALEQMQEEGAELSLALCDRLDQLGEALGAPPERSPRYLRNLSGAFKELAAEQRTAPPNEQIEVILEERFPQIRVLRDNDRELHSSYPFEEFERPPAPLENLLKLAGVEWKVLKNAAAEPGNPVLADIIRRGNRRLEERLRGSWKQASVSIVLEEQNGALNVYPYDADSDTHSRIEDRSDGFRSFLALLTFTARHSSDDERRLILAIDEAELHLHYNAQADLVSVLTQQTLATQIIYTTHSAGCLPEDLGSAIRVVQTEPGDRSSIENGFWSAQQNDHSPGGFTSLLMAMGADAVAFTPARHAVITEGPSDALLLPALLREALGKGPDFPLGLQVAGGLAWTPPRRLGALEDEAAHVVYLTDGDSAGEEYRRDLAAAGVEQSRIFALRAGSARGISIEDFIHKTTYVEVVNFLLVKLRGYSGPGLKISEVPSAGAAKKIEKWMKSRGITPISKTAVAEHALRLCRANLAYLYWDPGEVEARPLLRPNRRSILLRLHRDLSARLGIRSEN